MHLGSCSEPDLYGNACNIARYFISGNFTLPHKSCLSTPDTFLYRPIIDPYIRSFVRRFRHSYRIHFIDLRHIGYAAHLWAVFVKLLSYGISLPTSPCLRQKQFPANAVRSIKGAFQGVTLSFHLSDFQFSYTEPLRSFIYIVPYLFNTERVALQN